MKRKAKESVGSKINRKINNSVMKHKPKVHAIKNKFTTAGGVYSWQRLKVSLLAALVIYPIISLFFRQAIGLFGFVYEVQIGKLTAPVVMGHTYGFPFGGITSIVSLDPGFTESAFRIDIIGLLLSYLSFVLFAYFILTLFSDFDFGNRKAVRKAAVTLAISILFFTQIGLVAADQWNTIAEYTDITNASIGFNTGATDGSHYSRETFPNIHVFTGQNLQWRIGLKRDAAATSGYFSTDVKFNVGTAVYTLGPIGVNALSQSMTMWTFNYGAANGGGVGSAEVKWCLLNSQPSGAYVWVGGHFNGNPYPAGSWYYNFGTGEQMPGGVDYSDQGFGVYWYGAPVSIPSVTTNAATSVGTSTATLNGQLTNMGGDSACTVWFQYGTSTSYGSTTSTSSMSATGSFSKAISGLSADTTYHFRACASNSAGNGYGGDAQFHTSGGGPTYYILSMGAGTGGTTNPSPGDHSYTSGTQVTCTAIPNSGYQFSAWSGSYSGTTNPYTITMNDDKQLTASFTQVPTYTLTMAMGDGGSSTTPSVGQHTGYTAGSTQLITASAQSGYHFTSWSGTGSGSYTGTDNSHTITINGDITELAHFAQTQTYTLTMVMGTGGSSISPSAGAHSGYLPGDTQSISATAASNYQFNGWTGSGSSSYSGMDNPHTLTMNSDVTETANFVAIAQYSLTLTVDGQGTTVPTGTTTYNAGTQVQCTATPAAHNHFVTWSGDYTGTQNPVTITMSGPKIIYAHFAPDVCTLTITIDPSGTGAVTTSPSPPYTYNQQVTLTPHPNSQYTFDHWSGDLSGSDNPATLYMTGNKAVTATFEQIVLPPPKPTFNVNTTSLTHPGFVTFSWLANGATSVHFYLNDVDQGEFNVSMPAKAVLISDSGTKARIDSINSGGTTGSDVITITIGNGGTPGGFDYTWLLLIIIPIGLILFDRWLKKKPPFGKGESDYVTINVGDALRKVTGGKKATKKKTAVSTSDKVRTGAKKTVGKISSAIKNLLKRKTPPPEV